VDVILEVMDVTKLVTASGTTTIHVTRATSHWSLVNAS
jgi:hypothetical protein